MADFIIVKDLAIMVTPESEKLLNTLLEEGRLSSFLSEALYNKATGEVVKDTTQIVAEMVTAKLGTSLSSLINEAVMKAGALQGATSPLNSGNGVRTVIESSERPTNNVKQVVNTSYAVNTQDATSNVSRVPKQVKKKKSKGGLAARLSKFNSFEE